MSDGVLAHWTMDGDAFGLALLSRLEGQTANIVIERDDGFVDVDGSDYFAAPSDADPMWGWLRDRLGRRVLDIGAGAGRAVLALQEAGVSVLALDVSPAAVEVCRRRGVAETFVGTVEELAASGASGFDSFLGLGNNLGLIGTPDGATRFFDALRRIGSENAVLVGTMLDPYDTQDPAHLAYHAANASQGRMGGQVRLRVRYRDVATPWFDLLWASRDELAAVAEGCGWRMTATDSYGFIYAAELRPAST